MRQSEAAGLLCLHSDLDARIGHFRRLCSFVGGIVDEEMEARLCGAELVTGSQDALHALHIHLQPVDLPWPHAGVLLVNSLTCRLGSFGRASPKIHFCAGLGKEDYALVANTCATMRPKVSGDGWRDDVVACKYLLAACYEGYSPFQVWHTLSMIPRRHLDLQSECHAFVSRVYGYV